MTEPENEGNIASGDILPSHHHKSKEHFQQRRIKPKIYKLT